MPRSSSSRSPVGSRAARLPSRRRVAGSSRGSGAAPACGSTTWRWWETGRSGRRPPSPATAARPGTRSALPWRRAVGTCCAPGASGRRRRCSISIRSPRRAPSTCGSALSRRAHRRTRRSSSAGSTGCSTPPGGTSTGTRRPSGTRHCGCSRTREPCTRAWRVRCCEELRERGRAFPSMSMARRIFIVIGLWTLLHVYVGQRLLGHAPLGPVERLLGWAAILLLALAPFGAFFAGRAERVPAKPAFEWAGFTAMGLSSLLIVFVLAGDVLHVQAWAGADLFSAGVVGGAIAVLVAGSWRARRPAVVRVEVPIHNLPVDLEGFCIVQLSDLHVGPTLKRDFVERVVTAANGLQPDLIALTGDVADGFPTAVRDELAPVARLVAPYGKFFVTGNHEYYWDPQGWVGEVERLGFSPLINAHRLVRRGGGRLLVAGVTDRSASHRVQGHASDPVAALAGAPDSDVKLLLAHQPKSAFAARAAGFDLQLSGHTHGGQYFPFNLLVRLFQPFVAGLHRLEEMWLYVSRGAGDWGPPLPLGAPAAIPLLPLLGG